MRDGAPPPICPLPERLDLAPARSVLVLAPHADDETLGCGGTLALLKRQGSVVTVVVVTDGAGGDPLGQAGSDIVAIRRREADAAMAILGVTNRVFWSEPDGKVADTGALRGRLAKLVDEAKPDWLFLPSTLDYHRDHVAAGEAALGAMRLSSRRPRCFAYEVWSPLRASHVVDIGATMDVKLAALDAYASQLSVLDYRTAVKGLNAYRSLYCGGPPGYAECFLEIPPARRFSLFG